MRIINQFQDSRSRFNLNVARIQERGYLARRCETFNTIIWWTRDGVTVHRIDSRRNICIMDDVILRQNWNHVIHHKLRVRGILKNFDGILLSQISPSQKTLYSNTVEREYNSKRKTKESIIYQREFHDATKIPPLPSNLPYLNENELFTNLQFHHPVKYYKESLKRGFV